MRLEEHATLLMLWECARMTSPAQGFKYCTCRLTSVICTLSLTKAASRNCLFFLYTLVNITNSRGVANIEDTGKAGVPSAPVIETLLTLR